MTWALEERALGAYWLEEGNWVWTFTNIDERPHLRGSTTWLLIRLSRWVRTNTIDVYYLDSSRDVYVSCPCGTDWRSIFYEDSLHIVPDSALSAQKKLAGARRVEMGRGTWNVTRGCHSQGLKTAQGSEYVASTIGQHFRLSTALVFSSVWLDITKNVVFSTLSPTKTHQSPIP